MQQIQMDTLLREIRSIKDAVVRDQDGRWILHDVYCPQMYECSKCHACYIESHYPNCDKWNFCPNCGNRKIITGRCIK